MQIEYQLMKLPKLFATKRFFVETKVLIFKVFSYTFSELDTKCQFSRI